MRDKIVTAVLGDDLYVRTSHVFQYDYGLELMIEGIELPAEYEVHFSNKKRGVAKKGELVEGGAKIPDEYLRSGDNVYAWVYLRNGDDDGYTMYSIEIPVVQRSVEQGDNIDIIEHNIIDKTIEELKEAVAKSEENVTHYPYIDTETHHWMVYDADQKTFVDTGVDAEGEVTDVIDDTSGAGVTDKTWSADKLTTMDSELKTAIERKFGVSNLKANGGLQVETDIETGNNYLVTEVYGDTIAPNYFDLAFPVKQGQYCIFGRNLWIANTEIASQEYFNRNHWTQVDVGTSLETKEDKPDLVVTFTLAISGGVWMATSDKTVSEIVAAFTAGKTVEAYAVQSETKIALTTKNSSATSVRFSGILQGGYPLLSISISGTTDMADWNVNVTKSFVSEWGDDFYNANDALISYLGEPVDPQDAATKNYVDTHAVAVPDLEIVFSVETNAETGGVLFIVNKTWEEFLAAYNAGKMIKATFVNSYAGGAKCELTAIQYDSTSATAYFNGAITYQVKPRSVLVVWSANDLEYGHADFTVVDSALSTTSTNPVQNRIISAALDTKQDAPAIINFTITRNARVYTVTADKTPNELYTEYSAGKKIKAYVTNAELGMTVDMVANVQEATDYYKFTFTGVESRLAYGYDGSISGTKDGSWEYNSFEIMVASDINPNYDANFRKIESLADPTASADAVTKKYVDNTVFASKIRTYTITLQGNTSSMDAYFTGGLNFVNAEFTDKSRIIGYFSANDKYYVSFNYTINPKELRYSITILPGAPSGSIDLFIAEIA